ncbi:MAG: biopolymer transporter ExbD [Cryobacterium sp.]|nr:biopolymer transporter ExbD [Oligoflexia bacterium]
MALQITSMADIFTIILVFLLKSFSTGMATITPTSAMLLPSIEAPKNATIKEILTLEVSEKSVLLDQKPVLEMSNFSPLNVANFEPAITNALQSQRTKSRSPASEVEPDSDSKLLVLADEKVPYSTLQMLLKAAATAGYVDLQLLVTKPD